MYIYWGTVGKFEVAWLRKVVENQRENTTIASRVVRGREVFG